MRTRNLSLAVWLFGAVVTCEAHAQDTPLQFTLSIAVAVNETGERVVTDEWVRERVETANALFASASVQFVVRDIRSIDAQHAVLENRAARHALAALTQPSVINVFVVGALRDIDADGFRMGVHWRGQRPAGVHYVIASSTAARTTLAHELGHFFGNPHSNTPNNIMSYERDGSTPPFFDDAQLRRIRAHARRFQRTRELESLSAASRAASQR